MILTSDSNASEKNRIHHLYRDLIFLKEDQKY